MTLTDILNIANALKVTDVHVHANHNLWVRRKGTLIELENYLISENEVVAIFDEMITDKLKVKHFEEVGSVDFGFTTKDGNFRASFYKDSGSISLAIRVLPLEIPTLEQLGLPNDLVNLVCKRNGLILVTGATGNGKSTTLASLLNYVNLNYAKHIITIEDPIEYRYTPAKSLISQREIGQDCDSFDSALTASLRQDPDIILVGEMRDKNTILTALQAAETGHLVLSTLHTSSAASSIERIMAAFDDDSQTLIASKLANCLVAIISQVLIPRDDGQGLVCAYELLLPINSIQNMIRENKHHHISSFMQINKSNGIINLEDSLRKLTYDRVISYDKALNYANSPKYLASIINSKNSQ